MSNIEKEMIRYLFAFFVCLAGAVSSAIATPTDVLKVRMQVHGRGTDQIGLFGCFREVYQNEGIAGLWRVRMTKHYIYTRKVENVVTCDLN